MTLAALLTSLLLLAPHLALCQDQVDLDFCQVDDLAALLCDVCADLKGVSRDDCCADVDTLYACEQLATEINEDPDAAFNEVADFDYDDTSDKAEKRARWSWKKPTASRLEKSMWSWDYRGKRYTDPGRYNWKPSAYRDQADIGFRGRRAGFQWKPAAYYLDHGPRPDRLSYLGKRDEKRGRWLGRYDWKPAPYRMENVWDVLGKRTGAFVAPGRYDWKPANRYRGNLWKRGSWDWKPSTPSVEYTGESDTAKRFVIGPGRWNWKPAGSRQTNRYRVGKRGRWSQRPSGGYHDYGLNLDTSSSPGKRPYAQFDWKPANRQLLFDDKRSSDWKPWRPAAYNGPRAGYSG